jgi:predicted enzyme related to lactoylglutathione lyase
MGLPSTRKTKTKLRHYVSWFEIPVTNLLRAVGFYNFIYGIEMETTETVGYAMALFPADNGIGGALVMGDGSVPSETGTLVYLNAGKDLTPVLGRVEQAGGRIILGKTLISEEAGYFALFIDSEGNKLALHSKN